MLDPIVLLSAVLLLPVVALLGFTGCAALLGLDDVTYGSPPKIELDADKQSLGPGESHTFQLRKNDQVQATGVSWSPNAPNGTYSAPLPYNPNGPTQVTVTATFDNKNYSAQVDLIHATIDLNPSIPLLQAGGVVRFLAHADHTPLQTFDWAGSDPGVIPISASEASFQASGKYVLGTPPVKARATSQADASATQEVSVRLVGTACKACRLLPSAVEMMTAKQCCDFIRTRY
jgi:hypothetical protein